MKAMLRFTWEQLICVSVALAAIAFAIVGWVERTYLPYVILGVAGALVVELWVGVPLLRRFMVRGPVMSVEDFAVWMEAGEAAAGLRGLKPHEVDAAAAMTSSSIGLLASNSELLTLRLSTLSGRHGFLWLASSGMSAEAQKLSVNIRKIVAGLALKENWSPNRLRSIVDELESCAAGYDRLANKLFDLHREEPEVLRSAVEPLRRAAERSSRDLRRAGTNIAEYAKQLAG